MNKELSINTKILAFSDIPTIGVVAMLYASTYIMFYCPLIERTYFKEEYKHFI